MKKFAPFAPLAAMIVLTLALYGSSALFQKSKILYGADFLMLHAQRLSFARGNIETNRALPGWTTKEFFGTPFSANIHNFPFSPNRLALLLFDPWKSFAVAVVLSALLSALCMYAFARRAGLSAAGAAVAGWTFSAGGFFSARVMAGHLPLLEGYFSLPFLLLLVERAREKPGRASTFLLAAGTAAVLLNGHPQIPAYALLTALAYTAFHPAVTNRKRIYFAFAAGLLIASFAWFPMLELLHRSSRTLALNAAPNDVSLTVSRLGAFFLPWKDGWPSIVERLPKRPFTSPSDAVFWDTTAYIGWLPILALPLIKKPARSVRFFIAASVLALMAAIVLPAFSDNGWTVFRSPSRLLYIVVFSLSLAAGWVIDKASEWRWWAAAILALVQTADLFAFSSHFVATIRWAETPLPSIRKILDAELGSYRIAAESAASGLLMGRYDQIGYFDPVALKGPYQFMAAQIGLNEQENHESLSGAELPADALTRLGVKFVVTRARRDDLIFRTEDGPAKLYHVPAPRERVFIDGEAGTVNYNRPDPDRIFISVNSNRTAAVTVLEAYDTGWRATLDGAEIPISIADEIFMSVSAPAGAHSIALEYRTPGRTAGAALSAAGLLLALL